ncbi:hypothetical protein IG631_04146 [Alternaria alternata]|nr:hypothetical protein IG631_04146 [Alternaria alternata]
MGKGSQRFRQRASWVGMTSSNAASCASVSCGWLRSYSKSSLRVCIALHQGRFRCSVVSCFPGATMRVERWLISQDRDAGKGGEIIYIDLEADALSLTPAILLLHVHEQR